MNIGILGGSFDPIHNGHLHMAKCAYASYALDQVWLIPAGHSIRLPYFNVLNYIQIELIKRLRNNDLTDDEISLIHITINGIATGLRNSG